jgi:DNA-3-methyladenine glycosylase II
MPSNHINITAAQQHFKATDPIMYELLRRSLTAPHPIALPEPKAPEQYFHSIVTSIISQQISTKAASAVRGRVEALLGEVTPTSVKQVDHDTLKACGLSQQKVRYITHNADVWESLHYHSFADMNDEAVIAELTQLYGIGRWTAEMFLMFSLARPDVFSYGDLGLMQSLYRNYQYYPHYTRKIAATVEGWAPHRTVASLALWHTVDNGPVLL